MRIKRKREGDVKDFCLVLMLGLSVSGPAFAADVDKEAVATAAPVAATYFHDSEAAKKWKSLKAQEEWVARLKKQIQGETNQLAEMRKTLAEAFKLDIKKLESGQYDFDEKTGQFIEKK